MITTQPTKPKTAQKAGQCSGRGVGVFLLHDRRDGIQHDDQRQDGAGNPYHRLQPVTQELDELGKFHYRTAWTKRMKKPG